MIEKSNPYECKDHTWIYEREDKRACRACKAEQVRITTYWGDYAWETLVPIRVRGVIG